MSFFFLPSVALSIACALCTRRADAVRRNCDTKLPPITTTLPSKSLDLRYHNSTIINSDFTRGGINLENEKTADGLTSRLLLTRANYRDTGNYTCVPSTLPTDDGNHSQQQKQQQQALPTLAALPDSVVVHITTNSNQ